MTIVRCYFYAALDMANPAGSGHCREPYIDRCVLDVGANPQSSIRAPAKALLLRIIPDDPIHIEVNPPTRDMLATSESPILCEERVFAIGPDWSASFMEA